MALKPLGAMVAATQDESNNKTASGLYIPDGAQEKPATATVFAVGPDVKGVKKGDKIIFKSYSTTEVKVEGDDYILVKEEDVLAKVA